MSASAPNSTQLTDRAELTRQTQLLSATLSKKHNVFISSAWLILSTAPARPPHTWKTTWWGKVCLTQRTMYSVSDSVSSSGLCDDLKSGPRFASRGTAASCSVHPHTTHPQWTLYICTSNVHFTTQSRLVTQTGVNVLACCCYFLRRLDGRCLTRCGSDGWLFNKWLSC